MSACIRIRNAHENNLQHLTLDIPHYKLIVVCGVSGSGKSSLIADVLQQEGHRLFVENFLGGHTHHTGSISRPKADSIEGLFPVIAVNQQNLVRNSRSTIGTLTGIYDYLRLLFARLGTSEHPDIHIHRSLFSFNLPAGYCPHCKGVGLEDHIDTATLIGDENKTIREGAIVLTTPNNYIIYSQVTMEELDKVCRAEGFHVDIPWKDLTEDQKNIVFYGSEKIKILFGKHPLESRLKWTGITAKPREEGFYKGMVPVMEEILKRDRNPNILKYSKTQKCSYCNGNKLNNDALSVRLWGKSICEFSAMDFVAMQQYFSTIELEESDKTIASPIIDVMLKRLQTLLQLGLGHLNCDRESPTVNGGEAGRLRLASYAASDLRNVLYILDEPSAGLHPTEHGHLMQVLRSLVDKGNTVIIADHDEQSLREADWIIEIGPYAGIHGGKIIYNGDASEFFNTNIPESQTKKYLIEQPKTAVIPALQKEEQCWSPSALNKHNIQNLIPSFKLSAINVVTGLSGSGKTSLAEALFEECQLSHVKTSLPFRKVITMDSSPIGRTPRSNPATYTGLGDLIRDLLASTAEAKARAYKKGRFSFAVPGGRCEACGGAGVQQIGMHFLGNVDVVCESCNGKRFLDDTLEVKYKGKNIFDILELSMEEAHQFFSESPKIQVFTSILCDLGLGYMKLGQPSTGLSGGEAQRVKLATELARATSNNTLYILDEPANGLHNFDINVLVNALRKLAQRGHTLVCTENDPCFVLQADHIIDLGPGSGTHGGQIVFSGTATELINVQDSATARGLRDAINSKSFTTYNSNHADHSQAIVLNGVSTNNLKKINICFPENQITAVCGLSGSGKSSLVYGSLYAECHRLFLESNSAYLRQFTSMPGGAKVESSQGLMPVIALRKKNAVRNPRSIIAGSSGLYELYRLLFSRLGKDFIDHSVAPLSTAFSFNREEGACPKCSGMGTLTVCDPDKLITDRSKPLIAGAMDGSKTGKFYGDPYGQYVATLITVGMQKNIDFSVAASQLSKEAMHLAMYGCGDELFAVEWKYKRGNTEGVHQLKRDWPGFTGLVQEEYDRKHADARGEAMLDLMKKERCPLCKGYRLKQEVLKFTIGGMHIGALTALSAEDALQWFSHDFMSLFTDPLETLTAAKLQDNINSRLEALCKAGLGYLSTDRAVYTLSGGEYQRLQLAGLVRSPLTGTLYILDEPSFGLHPKDIARIASLIADLRAHGNTVVIVDHAKQLLAQADHLAILGPGAGEAGGQLVAEGKPAPLLSQYYNDEKQQTFAGNAHQGLHIEGAFANNLKNVSLDIPAGWFTVLTGVSGSGKSSLLHHVIYESFMAHAARNCEVFSGSEHFSGCLFVEQSVPLSTHSATISSYLEINGVLQKLFAASPESNNLSLKASHFSRQTQDGKCPLCEGSGEIVTVLDFLPDVSVACDQCNGSGWNTTSLKVKLGQYNIAEVEQLDFSRLHDFLATQLPAKKLEELKLLFNYVAQTGLSHLSASRFLKTLSGGELQRLKLVRGLISNRGSNQLIILDEPGAGLDPHDILKLKDLFSGLLAQGHSILCATHDEILASSANCIIELGPGGGKNGGRIVSND